LGVHAKGDEVIAEYAVKKKTPTVCVLNNGETSANTSKKKLA
jgi:hypothetical protein